MEKSIQIAYKLGKTAHNGQKRTGSNSPYFQHCKNVFKIVSSLKNKEDINLTDMQIMALLHDTIEDTQVTREEIEKIFGFKIADGVWALTKNSELSHIDALKNSLDKIKEYGKEAAIVKLADRIDNLKELNPEWNKKTALAYAESSKLICSEIGSMCVELNEKLVETIHEYIKKIRDYEKKGGYMKYLKIKNGYLFAYDEQSGITTKFKDDAWKLSDISYTALMHETDIKEITTKDAMTLTDGKNPAQLVKNITEILTID